MKRKRGSMMLDAIMCCLVLGLLMSSLIALSSLTSGFNSLFKRESELNVANINTIERLQGNLESQGKLQTGEFTEELTIGFKPLIQFVTVTESYYCNKPCYVVTISSRYRNNTKTNTKHSVILYKGM